MTKSKAVLLGVLLLGLLLGGVEASADTLFFSNDITGEIYQNAYISPYGATLNGTNLNVYCVDPNHEAYFGKMWDVNVSSLSGNLDATRLGSAGLVMYKEIAYLLFFNGYMDPTTTSATRIALQTAVWWIASNGQSSYGVNNSWVDAAQKMAAAGFNGLDFSSVRILSDAGGQYQEFMTMAPEPGSILLLATGLAGLGTGYLRPRRKRGTMAPTSAQSGHRR